MKNKPYIKKQLHELLYQSLEEEMKNVETAIGAELAEHQRDDTLKSKH